jgi:hypothetical protein
MIYRKFESNFRVISSNVQDKILFFLFISIHHLLLFMADQNILLKGIVKLNDSETQKLFVFEIKFLK